MNNASFFDKVYQVVKQIPKGKVATYGQVARLCGNNRMARQVGFALHVNPQPYVIPCHRVVDRFGNLKSFAFGGKDAQAELLKNEGVQVVDHNVDLQKYQWEA